MSASLIARLILPSCGMLLVNIGCSTVRSSSVRASAAADQSVVAFAGDVSLAATHVPEPAQSLGIVEAHGAASEFVTIVEQFKREVAALGGNWGKVDDIKTKMDLVTRNSSYSFPCGQTTCSGMRTQTVEVATTTVTGRAFKAQGESP
jgi:hypothetical protein